MTEGKSRGTTRNDTNYTGEDMGKRGNNEGNNTRRRGDNRK